MQAWAWFLARCECASFQALKLLRGLARSPVAGRDLAGNACFKESEAGLSSATSYTCAMRMEWDGPDSALIPGLSFGDVCDLQHLTLRRIGLLQLLRHHASRDLAAAQPLRICGGCQSCVPASPGLQRPPADVKDIG